MMGTPEDRAKDRIYFSRLRSSYSLGCQDAAPQTNVPPAGLAPARYLRGGLAAGLGGRWPHRHPSYSAVPFRVALQRGARGKK